MGDEVKPKLFADINLSPELLARVEANVSPEPNTGCWLWTGGTSAFGYPRIWADGLMVRVTRLLLGIEDAGLFACHACDQPGCVNPAHLFVGTPRDNMQDKISKGRHRNGNESKTHCPHGHEYTPENTLWIHGRRGRNCRACKAMRDARRRADSRASTGP